MEIVHLSCARSLLAFINDISQSLLRTSFLAPRESTINNAARDATGLSIAKQLLAQLDFRPSESEYRVV